MESYQKCPKCGQGPIEIRHYVVDRFYSCPECEFIKEDHSF